MRFDGEDSLSQKKIMKKQYTKAFICEAIAYWKKQLKKLNESSSDEGQRYGSPLAEIAKKLDASQETAARCLGELVRKHVEHYTYLPSDV